MKFNLNQKAIMSSETDENTLIITGVASDTSKDRYNEYVTSETLQSLCEQATKLNLHYNHEINEVIGIIIDSTIKNNQLYIKAKILPEYASDLREKLEFGVNYGLSISGIAEKKEDALTSYDLVEISLTEEPANANTYATVQIDNQKTLNADCLNGLCYLLNKEDKDMSDNDNNNNENTQDKNEYITVDDLNNALNEYKEELLNTLRDEFKDDIINDEEFKNSLVEAVLNEIVEEESEVYNIDNTEELSEQTNQTNKAIKSICNVIDEKFNDFEAKYFKKLDETRNPDEHKINFKNQLQKSRNNKKTIREIANTYRR